MNKVILMSGGIDSAVAMANELQQGNTVLPLAFDYNSEKQFVKLHTLEMFCGYYLITPKILPIMTELFTEDGTNVPNNPEARNMVLIASAVSYAMVHNADSIVIAVNNGDLAKDSGMLFLDKMSLAISALTFTKVALETPFLHKTKQEIIDLGKSLNVPFNLTMFCDNNTNPPCGTCTTCTIMAKAGLI